MSLFDFFRHTRPPERRHPVFGRIVYQDDNTWERGQAFFPPVGHDIEVLIDAGPDGPGDEHLRYWSELAARWPALTQACEPLLRKSLAGWITTPERGDLWSRLKLESLDVFPGSPPDEWELAFWCEEASHWPTLTMAGWTPTSCFIDG